MCVVARMIFCIGHLTCSPQNGYHFNAYQYNAYHYMLTSVLCPHAEPSQHNDVVECQLPAIGADHQSDYRDQAVCAAHFPHSAFADLIGCVYRICESCPHDRAGSSRKCVPAVPFASEGTVPARGARVGCSGVLLSVHHSYTALDETISATQDTAIIKGNEVGSTVYTVISSLTQLYIHSPADKSGSAWRSMIS